MRRTLMRRHAKLAVLSLLTLAAVAAFALQPARGGNGRSSQVIATSSGNGFRTVVTATRADRGPLPAATVKIAAFERRKGAWQQLGSALTLGTPKGWFWYVVTGPRSLRDFSLSTNGERPVSLRLLLSPSIGWSQRYRFHIETGALVRG